MDTLKTTITRCDPASFDVMVAFIAELNRNAEDHIGFFDTTAEDVARSSRVLALLPVDEGFQDFVAVTETARGRGIGAQLVAAAVHSAFDWPSIDVVRLTVSASNASALRLYERLGFLRERTMMGFEKNVAVGP